MHFSNKLFPLHAICRLFWLLCGRLNLCIFALFTISPFKCATLFANRGWIELINTQKVNEVGWCFDPLRKSVDPALPGGTGGCLGCVRTTGSSAVHEGGEGRAALVDGAENVWAAIRVTIHLINWWFLINWWSWVKKQKPFTVSPCEWSAVTTISVSCRILR